MKQPDIEELPEYEELFQKLVEAMPLEKRLAGLTLEQRLAGLTPEQVILLLPVEVLRMLSEEHLQSLPADVQETVKQRLRGTAQ
ncbi:hypothetical protein BE21_47740 [Sorangium cellulosum]|uniref:Uncharacterized protein n=1 Tax=Sorangium cellulosum TaxID=56 RepID=A0A150THU6_SORCE|nr:hypothetical protein BE21_47740 [Sorangium cellulosum]